MNKKISEFVAKYFAPFETLFLVALAVSLFVLNQEVSWALYAVYGVLGLLALLYLLMSLRPFEKGTAGIRIMMRRVVYISYMLGTLSFMSALTFDENVDTKGLTIASLCFVGVSIVLLLLKRFKMKETAEFVPNIIRCGFFVLLLSWLLVMFAA